MPSETTSVAVAPESRQRYWLEAAIIAVLYWALAQVALRLAFTYEGVSPLWPSAGIAFAFLYRSRLRQWPAVFVGAFVVACQVMSGTDLPLGAQLFCATGVAFGNLLESLIAVYLLCYFVGDAPPLGSLRALWAFLASIAAATAIGAALGVSTLTLFDVGLAPTFHSLWLTWWVGDSVGAILFAPFVLGLFEIRQRGLSYLRLLEACALFGLLVGVCALTFGLWQGPSFASLVRPPLLLPLMIWAVVRLRLPGAAFGLILVTAIAIYATVGAELRSPDALAMVGDNLLMLQMFVVVIAMTTYCLHALLEEREALETRLRDQNLALEAAVGERTERLENSNVALKNEILERQQIAWALSASEEKMRLILELATESIVLLDVDSGRVVECNRIAHERLGYARDEFLNMSIAEFDGCLDGSVLEKHLAWVRREGFDRFETEHRSKDGSRRDVMVSARMVNLRGRDYLLATFSDITELKDTERRLAESEQKHRDMVEGLQEGIWAVDADGITTFVNARMGQMLGYGVDEMLGRHLFHFMAPNRVEECRANLRRRAKGISEEHEFEFMRRDGTFLVAHVATSPVMNALGEYAGAIAGVMDIGYLKRIEANLRESEQRLLQVINLVPHILFARDVRGHYLLANRALADALGRPAEDVLGKRMSELGIAEADEEQSLLEDREVIASGQAKSVPQELFIDAAGNERIVQTTKIPFTQIGSSEPAVLGISIDITASRQAEQLMAGRNLLLELIARGVPLSLILDELLRLFENLFPELYCAIMLIDSTGRALRFAVSPRLPPEFMQRLDGMPIGEAAGCCGHAAFSGELTIIDDIEHHPYSHGLVGLAQQFGWRACWSSPIRSAFGDIHGTFSAYAKALGGPTEEQLTVMRSLSQMAAIAIDRRQREQALTRLKHAVDRSGSMILITDLERRIEYANSRLCEIAGYRFEELRGQEPTMFRASDVPNDAYEGVWDAIAGGQDWRGELRVQSRNGQTYWVVISISRVNDEAGKPMNYVFVCEDVTAIKLAHDEMQQLAFHDTLTGLENRRLFKERLDHAVHMCERSGKSSALLFLDLDNFKGINDSLGHEAGDVLLQTVAARLLTCVRQEDCVARLGGDEFTVLLQDVDNERGAIIVAEKIIEVIRQPVMLAGDERIQTSTSVGITMMPLHGTDSEALMKHADSAMYQAKSAGRNTYRMYVPEPDQVSSS